MSCLSPKVTTKTTSYYSRYGPGKTTVQESITNSATKSQNPTKYTETRVRYGRPGSENAQEIITKKYQQSSRMTETTTRYDPKTGTTQKTTTTSYNPETKVITQTRRRYGSPNTDIEETTTTSYNPENKVITQTRRRYGSPNTGIEETTTTTTKSTRYQPQAKNADPETKPKKRGYDNLQMSHATSIKNSAIGEPPQTVVRTRRKFGPNSSVEEKTITTKAAPGKITETKRKYGSPNCTTEETIRTITKPEQSSTVTEKIERHHFTSSTLSPTPKVTESRRRYQPSSNQDEFVTAPIKVNETKTRYGPETKTSKEITYTTYQKSRARPITDNCDEKVYVVSEKRNEKYTNDNGNEKKYVTVEKTTSDGGNRREVRRFYASNK